MNVFDRINIAPIIKLHLESFYDYRERETNGYTKVPFSDKFIFLIFPASLSLLLTIMNLKLNLEYFNVIVTSLSIFTGLLFSLLTLIFESVKKEKENTKHLQKERDASSVEEQISFIKPIRIQEKKLKFTVELFQNIAFTIALSLITIVAALITQLKLPKYLLTFLKKWEHYLYWKLVFFEITNFVAFFLIIQFVLALLMILKRFFLLFLTEKIS
jgi:hypothetical protein